MSEHTDRILACACELYLADGLEGFSMRKLARTLGVTAPALYRHYDSKEQVLLDVVGEGYRHQIQFLYRALEGRSPDERFRMAGEGYLDFALTHPRYYEVLYRGIEPIGRAALTPEVVAQAAAIAQFWNDRVREAMDAGLLERGDTDAVGMTLWAHAHGLISLYLEGMLPLDEAGFRRLYRESHARMFMGLGTRPFASRLAEAHRDAPARATA
jgi:AcrR family transcriptional regulator